MQRKSSRLAILYKLFKGWTNLAPGGAAKQQPRQPHNTKGEFSSTRRSAAAAAAEPAAAATAGNSEQTPAAAAAAEAARA